MFTNQPFTSKFAEFNFAKQVANSENKIRENLCTRGTQFYSSNSDPDVCGLRDTDIIDENPCGHCFEKYVGTTKKKSGSVAQCVTGSFIRNVFTNKICDIQSIISIEFYCVKSVQIWSFFWSVFSCIRTRKNSVFGHFSLAILMVLCKCFCISCISVLVFFFFQL